MKVSPALILGIVIGVATLTFVKHSSMMGIECFHTTEQFLPSTKCLHPAVYYGPLALAALLVILGVVELLKKPDAPGQ